MHINREELDQIKGFIEANFSDPIRDVRDYRDDDGGYIQISTPLKNSAGDYVGLNLKDLRGEPWVHYEIIDNRIELHLECYGDKKKIQKINSIDGYLINKLINKSEKNSFAEKLKRDDKWEKDGIRYYLDEVFSFDDKEKIEKTLKNFMDFFDGLICEYNKPTVFQESIKEESSDSEVSLRTMDLKTVFGLSLSIPDYQRIYCWEDKNVTDLWNSLIEMQDEYHLGAIILHENEGKCDIIDGQQRLVTLTIILKELGYDEGKLPLLNASFKSKDARNHIANTMSVIEKLKEELTDEKIKELVKQLINNLIFSVLILDNNNLDLAYTFFSNQNSKGVPLSDYDLLKAHHLRYIYLKEEEQEHLAKQWNKMIGEEEGLNMLEWTLGTHLYRLRKWMRKNGYNAKERLRVKEEFSAAPIMEGIPPFGEKFDFYEKIQGGSHFFAYTNHFVYLYKEFSETKQCKLLQEHLQWETHHRYGSVIETLLFAYFLKFGKQYLSEALFCIAGIIAQHRYNSGRADMDKIRDHARDMEVVMMIDQATSPTFFFAETLPHIKVSGKSQEKIKGRFYNCLMDMFKKLDDFTDKTIKENVKSEYRQ